MRRRPTSRGTCSRAVARIRSRRPTRSASRAGPRTPSRRADKRAWRDGAGTASLDLIDGPWQLVPGPSGRLGDGWSLPLHVRRGLVEDVLELEGGQIRVAAEDQRADAGHVRRGKAVPGRADRAAAEPGHRHVDAAGEE